MTVAHRCLRSGPAHNVLNKKFMAYDIIFTFAKNYYRRARILQQVSKHVTAVEHLHHIV